MNAITANTLVSRSAAFQSSMSSPPGLNGGPSRVRAFQIEQVGASPQTRRIGPSCKNSAEKINRQYEPTSQYKGVQAGPPVFQGVAGRSKSWELFEMARSLFRTTLAVLSLASILPAGLAQAQQVPFPTRPITLIVPF